MQRVPRIVLPVAAALAVSLAFQPAGAQMQQPFVYGYCTQQELYALQAQGYAPYQIQQYCSTPKAFFCVTQAGTCQLASPVYSGSPCTCFTQWGPIHGVSR